MRRKRALAALLLALAALLLSGCMNSTVDELLSLPQPSEEYLELQKSIDEILASGAVYSAPSAGSYRQSVQLYDVNGDGTNEALAFFSMAGEKPLKIYIFRLRGSGYETAAVIEGDGTEIASISYLDMNKDGWAEIVVGWKMGSEIQMLNIYSLKGFAVSSVAATDYNEYLTADLDGNGREDLLVMREVGGDDAGCVVCYSMTGDGETESSEARMSPGSKSVAKAVTGQLSDGVAALFVESVYGGTGLITDIFISRNGQLQIISTRGEGVSESTVRYYTVYCRDINGDGVMEIPIPRSLPAQGETGYRALDWYSYSSRGLTNPAVSTYHNYSDSCYLILPKNWRGNVTVRREDSATGERAVVFSVWNGEDKPVTDFLKIIALSGENRAEAAVRGTRQVLKREDEVIYSAELLLDSEEWEYMVDFQYLREHFSLIYSEWITGLT